MLKAFLKSPFFKTFFAKMVEGGLETMAVCREDAKDRRRVVSRIGLGKNIVTNYLISFK